MSLGQYSGLFYFTLSLLFFLIVQHWLHRELQALFLLISRHTDLGIGLFSLLLFPGVLLHELSHFCMAKILRVPTGKISLLPKILPDGKLRMGFVETAHSDPIRELFIGTAPFLSGAAIISWIGISRLQLFPLAEFAFARNWSAVLDGLTQINQVADLWVWFYLCFAISSTMLPSESDRQGWRPVALVLFFAGGLAFLAGAGPWIQTNLMPIFNQGLYFLSLIFTLSLVIHLVLAIPVALLTALVSRMTGLKVI